MIARPLLGIAVLALLSAGCSTVPKDPYPYSRAGDVERPRTLRLAPGEPQFTRGRPHKLLDASDWYNPYSLIGKLVLWNAKVDSHEISPETEAILTAYLRDNNLQHVKVRINDYDVPGEWRRLKNNAEVGAGWRWTLGLLACSYYTILPGRFFGGDHYNPYTNTINLYSDHPAIALHEAAHAKDFALKTWKGTYAAVGAIPFVPLWHEAEATSDAVGYLRAEGEVALEKDAYKILYPAYSTYIGGEAAGVLQYFPVVDWIYYSVAYGPIIPAHIVGRIKAATRDDPVDGEQESGE